jgi:hypothetical protein
MDPRMISGILSNENRLRVFAAVSGEARASIIKGRLESEGIPCMLRWELGRIGGITFNGLGEFRICVHRKNLQKAQRILELEKG